MFLREVTITETASSCSFDTDYCNIVLQVSALTKKSEKDFKKLKFSLKALFSCSALDVHQF